MKKTNYNSKFYTASLDEVLMNKLSQLIALGLIDEDSLYKELGLDIDDESNLAPLKTPVALI